MLNLNLKSILTLVLLRAVWIAAIGVTIEASTTVKIPRAKVWRHVSKMKTWDRWQPVFSVEIDGAPAVGKTFAVTCHWSDGTVDVANEKIVTVERQRSICWVRRRVAQPYSS